MSKPEVQFVVERICKFPNLSAEQRRERSRGGIRATSEVITAFPLPIWVEWPPEQNISFGCDSPVVYRVSDRGIDDCEKRFNQTAGTSRYLCSHMGQVIE